MKDERERLAALEVQVQNLMAEVADLNTDRKNMMRWGVMALGAAVVSLGVYIWGLR